MSEYFLKGYSLVLGLTMPISVASALLAEDLIVVVLGPKWGETAVIFRYLSPTILALAMINPFSWLLFAQGMVRRSLNIAFVLSPLVIVGYLVGLPNGPRGVALAYSAVMVLWVIPHICWAIRGTGVAFVDVVASIRIPLISSLAALCVPLLLRFMLPFQLPALLRLSLLGSAYFVAYFCLLLFVMNQRNFYAGILSTLLGKSPREGDTPAAA
jgi:PST family polysaccharide transporter